VRKRVLVQSSAGTENRPLESSFGTHLCEDTSAEI